MKENEQLQVVTESTIVESVLTKITKFKESGELKLPQDYSAENALKSAYLVLTETIDKNKQPVLKTCSQVSIANTLLNMVVQGLSPMKNQCYFIAYNGKLQLSRSYLGSIAIARRVGLKSITANVVYEDDTFSYSIDKETGLFSIIEHEQDMSNIDIEKIRGAYAVTTLTDGASNLVIMTLKQIKTAWMQGYAKGKSGAHSNFTDEMCKKTVIQRACKTIINSSTDANLDIDNIFNKEESRANIKEIAIDVTPNKPVKKEKHVKKESEASKAEEVQVAPVQESKNNTQVKAGF